MSLLHRCFEARSSLPILNALSSHALLLQLPYRNTAHDTLREGQARERRETWERIFGKEELKVCILGLDNAGKTTVLYKLTLGEVISTAPTVGSNVEMFQHKNLNIRLWDIGGQSALRQSWAQYYAKSQAIILVIDSADRERLSIAKAELHKMANDENLSGAAMLVLANKQDIRGAASAAEISEGLDLTLLKDRPWHIVACSALTGKGLEEGLDWLTLRLSGK